MPAMLAMLTQDHRKEAKLSLLLALLWHCTRLHFSEAPSGKAKSCQGPNTIKRRFAVATKANSVYKENKTPVLGNATPDLGVKLKRG